MERVDPNWFAYAALLIWPAVALYFYSKLSIAQATLWTILGAYMLLPVRTEIKFEMLPALNKLSIPNVAAFVGCALCARRRSNIFHGFGPTEILILLLLSSPFITSILNSDPVHIGAILLPGVGAYDGGSAMIAQFIFILPFFLGRQFLRGAQENADVLRAMVVAGLAYSILMLFEIRMSPQLHSWIYGYFPHDFTQQIRDGGFRPVVFIGHGLLVAFFAMTTTVAAATFWRTRVRVGELPPGGIVCYLSFVLMLCKTGSALIYGAVLVPLVRWASPRLQIKIACIFAIIALTYPMLRFVDVLPTTSLLEMAGAVDADRAASLATRFTQEGRLLERALERPLFGWGRFGRSRIYDAETGIDVSITDGHWIVTMGQFGLIGFIAEFGLFALPIFQASRALKFAQSTQEKEYLAALALIVAISMIDQLPNSSISPWTWLLVGALLGRAESLRAAANRRTLSKDLNSLSTFRAASNATPGSYDQGMAGNGRERSSGL